MPEVTPTWTINTSPTATPVPSSCVGDCDANGSVHIQELVTCVGIALGAQPLAACPACAPDPDALVMVSDLLRAVNNALVGCSASLPTPTPTSQRACQNRCFGVPEAECYPAYCGDFAVAGACRPLGVGGECGCDPFECAGCDVFLDPIPDVVDALTVTISGNSSFVPEIEVDGGDHPVFAEFRPNAPPLLSQHFTADVPLHPGMNQLTVLSRRKTDPPPCYSEDGPFAIQAGAASQ